MSTTAPATASVAVSGTGVRPVIYCMDGNGFVYVGALDAVPNKVKNMFKLAIEYYGNLLDRLDMDRTVTSANGDPPPYEGPRSYP